MHPASAAVVAAANDPMCYPQLNPQLDFRDPSQSYAQALREYIAFVLSSSAVDPLDATTIY